MDWGHLPAPPFLTYTEGITLWSGGLRCDVRYVGTPAHTTNDSIIHIPERSVVFTGDLLFNGGTPFALQGSVSGWIDVLQSVLRPLGAQTLVPGHGPVCGPKSSTTRSPTCISCKTPHARRRRPACHPCRPPARRTWGTSRIFLIPSG